MAKTAEVTALDSGIQDKVEYRGNVQVVMVTEGTGTAATAYEATAVLPQKAKLIASMLNGAGTFKLGNTGDDDAYGATQADNTLTINDQDVGGKIITVTPNSTGAISGFLLIATNE